MEIDERGIAGGPERTAFELVLDRRKGIGQRLHLGHAHDIDDQNAAAIAGGEDPAPRPGVPPGSWPAAASCRPLDEHQRLALVEGMVTKSYDVGAGRDELVMDRLGDAEAPGGVLAIDDHESSRQRWRSPGRRSITALRPVRPTTSPRKRTRIRSPRA